MVQETTIDLKFCRKQFCNSLTNNLPSFGPMEMENNKINTFLYAWSTTIERSLGWSRPAGSVLSQNRAKNYCHAILKTTSGKNFSNPLWQSSGKKERKKMGCLLSCHVALLSLEAVVLLDALTMFVLKSDPQVDTRLKWGSPSALPPQRRQHSAIRTYIATTRHLHTSHSFAAFDSWFSSLKCAYYILCNDSFQFSADCLFFVLFSETPNSGRVQTQAAKDDGPVVNAGTDTY